MRKRILSILLCLVMVVGLFPTMAIAADGSGATTGSGTASDPYIVTTFEELKAELEKKTVGLGMQYIKVPSGTNIKKVLKLDVYASAIEIQRQKTLIVDGTITVTGAASGRVVRSLLHINGSGERLDIKGKGSLTFEANSNGGATNAVVDVENNATVNISGGVTLTGAYNLATYGIAVYNYGGTVNIDNATLKGETGGVSYGAAIFALKGTTNIKNATVKSSVLPGTNITEKDRGTIFVREDASLTIENSIIHTTDGVTDGHSICLERDNTKHISDYLGANQKIYKLSDNTPLSADVSSLTDSVNITDNISKEIDTVSLTISGSMLNTISDFERISYAPYNRMKLNSCIVYKGLGTTSDKIENEDTPYDPHQDYTVMYTFEARSSYSFADTVENQVSVSGGDFLMADNFGGSTNKLRVFVNFPSCEIDKVNLTIKPKDERTKISDLEKINYSPANGMTLTNCIVYKGLNNREDKINNKNTPYYQSQSYTAMYVFATKEGFSFLTNVEKNVSISGGDFWEADTFGGSTNKLRVFVNFPGNTPIDSVTLNVPELPEGATTGGNFTLSGTNTGVSTINTVWENIPTDGAVAGNFCVARITLTAEDGYAFNTKTQVNLNGDYSSKGSGIDNGGAGMTVLVSVPVRHEHTFSGEWQYLNNDKEYHFKTCSCGAQTKEPHNLEYNETLDKYQCICGYWTEGTKTEIQFVAASPRSPIDGESPSNYTPEQWVHNIGKNYTVASIEWKDEDGNAVTTFESGKIYKGTVTFKADDGFKFDKDRIQFDRIFDTSTTETVEGHNLDEGATTLIATFKLKDNTVVRPGLSVKVKLPTLSDKIGQSFPAAELVDTTLPDDVELTTSVVKNIFDVEPTTGPVESNKTYFYWVKLQLKGGSDVTKAYNVSYTVTDGGDAVYHTDNLAGEGILARYQTPDASATSKISSVALTVTAPKYGEAPETSATGANNTLYTVGTPTWSPAVTDGKFGADTYTVSIPVTAASGYSFDANCLYTVNGYVATYADGKVSYTFPALTAPHEHTFGTWEKWNDSEHYQSCTCGEMKFELHKFGNWTPDPADATKHYKECSVCHHKVVANHVESNQITDTHAGIGTPGAWHTVCVDCGETMNTGTFPALVKIDVAKLTVAKPVKDATAEMATTGDSTYYVANTEWTAADGATLDIGDKFQPGTAYTVKITLEAKNSNVFTADSTYNKIEGKDAKLVTAVTGYTDSVILTYTFDATEGTYVPTKPAITTATLADGKVGEAYNQTLAATGTNPIAWGIETGTLPDGLTLVNDTIKGTPSKAGEFKFTVKATNVGGSDTKELTIKIADADSSKYHNVTLSGAGTGATGAGSHAEGTTVNIYAGTKSGYTFNGWTSDNVTVLSASSKNASFVMPDTDVTVKANWVYNGGGSSGGGYTYYTIKATAGVNGSISPTGNVSVREGRDQTFTITPDKGYAVAKVLIDSKNVGAVKSYTFENVKKNHTIEVVFMKASGNPQTGVFVDVPEGSYYEEAVNWAVEKGITTGTDATHFSPDGICTRAQAVTFLWRAAGSPVAKSAVMPFTDVKAGSYYYDAVLWAVENGITKGTSDTMFSPDATCSRAQIVTFLWRSQKSPAAGTANPFTDVKASAYYADAVLWAVKEDITKGTTNTTFSPDTNCTRAQIVTFIWRALAE